MTREEQSVKMGKRLKALREETPLNGKKMSHEKLKKYTGLKSVETA